MTTSDENTVPEPIEGAPVVPAPPAAAVPAYAAPAAPPQAYAAPNDTPNTWMNIVAFVTGLLGLAIVPIIFGHLGIRAANKGKADLKWMGIVGAILGYLELVFWMIFWALIIGGTLSNVN